MHSMISVYKKVSCWDKKEWDKDLASKPILMGYYIDMSYDIDDRVWFDVVDTVYRKMKDETDST